MSRMVFRIVLLSIIATSFSGCMLLNPTKRRPIDNISYNERVQPIQKSVLVHFSEHIPQKPLEETVWDNNGPFWDQKESNQIGFTQNYQIIPVPGAATAVNTGTRIVIPLGRYLTEMTKSVAQKAFSESSFCSDNKCVDKMLSKQNYDYTLSINIKNFRVWETHRNKINYSIELKYSFITQGKETSSGTIKKSLNDESLGGGLPSSYSVIAKMKEITNNYTEEIVSELISKVVL